MNRSKLHQLLKTARSEPAPAPSTSLESRIMRAIRLAPTTPTEPTISETLNVWFPRIALTAATMIALCIAGDHLLSAFHWPDLEPGVVHLSSQWLFTEGTL